MIRCMLWVMLAVAVWQPAAGEDTRQGIFYPSFRTLEVTLGSNRYVPPVISLHDASDRIVIAFDELSEQRRYMRYSLTHCDARWQPEGLVES